MINARKKKTKVTETKPASKRRKMVEIIKMVDFQT